MFVPLILSKCLWGLGKEIYNKEKPTKAQKTQSTRKEKVGGVFASVQTVRAARVLTYKQGFVLPKVLEQ